MVFTGIGFVSIAAASILVMSGAQASFLDKPSVVTYWGQNSKGESGSQKPLSAYCDDSSDALVMSFTLNFRNGELPALNLANACEKSEFPGTSLLSCPQITADIKTCQQKGKAVLMSLGGATGSYGFANDADAESFADTLWNIYGGGESDTRPFGDAVLDGFDLDIEGGGPTGYAAMVKRLRTHFATDSGKRYYITGAPQCPFPDAMMGAALDDVGFDAVFVQFYNNFCATASNGFNFNTWDKWAKETSPNKDVKVLIGIPGSRAAAGSGYVPFEQLGPIVQNVHSTYSSFGGIMLWDASASYANTDTSPNYQSAIASLVNGLSGGQTIPTTSDIETTTTSQTISASETTDIDEPTATGTGEPITGTAEPTTSNTATATESSSTQFDSDPTSDVLTSTDMNFVSNKATVSSKTKATETTEATITETAKTTKTASDYPSKTTTNDATPTATSAPGTCVSQDESCSTEGQYSCFGNSFATCDHGKWNVRSCPSDHTCFSATDGASIYCAQGIGSSSSNSCLIESQKSKNKLVNSMTNPVAKPYRNGRIVAQFSVANSNSEGFNAIINARRFDQQTFGKTITVQFKVANNIMITQVENGKVIQKGNDAKVQVQSGEEKSMVSIIRISGKVTSGVFIAPSANTMKFTS